MNCDIIIPIWNQPELTKATLESIIRNTEFPHKLILVDNASDDETRKYLEGVSGGSKNIFLAKNPENLGFIKAVNKGILASNSGYICVMNNDTLATKGWLNEIIKIFENNPIVGAVNPASNNFGIFPAKNETIAELAKKLKADSGKWIELNSCIGFCMVFKRELINKIGLFDEIYGMGNFEDTDYSRKIQRLGLKCVMAKGAYVWHEQNTSFKLLNKFDESFEKNREIFESRWGKILRVLYVFTKLDANNTVNIPEKIKEYLNKGNWVTLAMSRKLKLDGLLEHSGVKIINFSENTLFLGIIFKVLFKKKKFDYIYTDNPNMKKIMDILRPIHKAEIINIKAQ